MYIIHYIILKIYEVDTHIGAAMSGLVGDARSLVDFARLECQNHRFSYDEVGSLKIVGNFKRLSG